jgi:hypothetical protein
MVAVVRGLFIAILAFLLAVAAGAAWVVLTEPQPRAAPGWERMASLPQARGEAAAAVAERDEGALVFMVGGFTGLGRVSARVDVYDPAEGVWHTGPPLPAPRHHPAAAALGGDVYVSGGAATGLATTGERDLWVRRAGATGWESLEPMPEPRFAHRMVAVAERLYVVGGHARTNAVLVYSPEEGWSTGAELPQARDHLGAVAVDGEIWVLGGRHDGRLLDRVDVYDVAADRWREGPPLPARISAAAVGVTDGGISVVGGEDPDPLRGWVSARHWRLDLATGEWAAGPPPILRTHGAADAVVDGGLHVLGGASRQGLWSALSWSSLVQTYEGG